MFLPINVNHQQHGNSSWFTPNRADCVPALLFRYWIDTVRADQAKLVFKNESGQFESDSAVVSLISEIFSLVPFVLQCVCTDCTTNALDCGGFGLCRTDEWGTMIFGYRAQW